MDATSALFATLVITGSVMVLFGLAGLIAYIITNIIGRDK